MIKNVLTHLGGIEAYGVLSIALFFVFFTGVLVWAGCKKKPHLDAMSVLPLDDATPVGASTKVLQGATALPPGSGLRQSSGAVGMSGATASGRGLPQSRTLSRHPGSRAVPDPGALPHLNHEISHE